MLKKGGWLFLFSCLMTVFFSFSMATKAASLSFVSPAKLYKPGDLITVTFNMASTELAVNAVAAVINYPVALLELTAVSVNDSIISFWVEQPKKTNTGKIALQGVIFNPGYKGVGAKLVTLTFKAKKTGLAILNVKDFQILANDGKGTVVKTSVANKLITLGDSQPVKTELVKKEPEVEIVEKETGLKKNSPMPKSFVLKSATHPLQNTWYSSSAIRLNWTLPSGVQVVSYKLDRQAKSDPGEISRGKISSIAYQKIDNGIWYFHIKLKIANNWTDTVHYQLKSDYIKPILNLALQPVSGQAPLIKYSANDNSSGIKYYEISLDNGSLKRTTTAGNFSPKGLMSGYHVVKITVFDKAGNQASNLQEFNY